ncbi:MAG: phosphoglucosamine mutase, partial [Prevotellaceae bacterium]|nr:phosphoglucosamine mutase [Prevotellaceae bacterium]
MSLIKSISGIRGTVGGQPGEALTPVDAVNFAAAYAAWLRTHHSTTRLKVVVGRDARISGLMLDKLVCGTLMACGVDVVNLGLATTPTIEMAVVWEQADGGIILTASHNPKEWNALKLLNEKGEFLSAADGEALLRLVEKQAFDFVDVGRLGIIRYDESYTDKHIEAVCQYPLVDV